jgi:hypothetical protein
MISHQHIGMYLTTELAGRFAKILHIGDVIEFMKEACLPIVSTLDDMLGNARKVESFHPRHVLTFVPLEADSLLAVI